VISLLHAGAGVQSALEGRSWRFCFIGGIANFRWGELAELKEEPGLVPRLRRVADDAQKVVGPFQL